MACWDLIVSVDTKQLMSLEQIQAFLKASDEVRFEASDREQVYGWVERVLRQQQWRGVLFEPSVTFLMRRSAGVKILADARTQAGVLAIFGTQEYPSAVLYAKAEWLSANSDAARRLAHAIRHTLVWIQQNTTKDIAEAMPASFQQEDPAAYMEALEHSKAMYSSDGVIRDEAAQAVKRVLGLSLEKVRSANVDLSRTYTNEFLAAN